MRLGQLLTVLFIGMFVTAFFYSVSGVAPTGIDEDCDGEDDFDPLPLWEQAVFAIMASLMQAPATLFLTVLFSMAGDACFLARYFPIWRELELRKVAEVHLGQKVSGLRRKLQVLQTTLANWIEITPRTVGRDDIEQLRMISELLGDENTDRLIDQVVEGRSKGAALDHKPLGNSKSLVDMHNEDETRTNPLITAASTATDTDMDASQHRRAISRALKKQHAEEMARARTQRNATRLQLIRALRDYGDFMAQAYRSELSCMGYAWSWRCADMLGCCFTETRRVQLEHLKLVARLTALLGPTRDFTDPEEKKVVTGICRGALRRMHTE